MVAIGLGPGPKNVLAEFPDGKRVVFPYRVWKYQYAQRSNLAEQKKEYRAVHGFVQFEPREGEAGGKTVRNITVRQAGFGPYAVRVSATLWPSHAHVPVEEGDLVTLEGSYTQNKSKDKDDNPITYHNISVARIKVFGQGDSGSDSRAETVNVGASDTDDEDLGF